MGHQPFDQAVGGAQLVTLVTDFSEPAADHCKASTLGPSPPTLS
jgi:hypothetical protein